MEFRILGPLQVLLDGEVIRLEGHRQEIVLALLLVHADRVVSLEYLIDAVWEDRPPSTARRQIQNCVATLRRRLGASRTKESSIVAEGAGYRMRPGPDALDSRIFTRRVADAHRMSTDEPAGAVAALREALALWRGPALSGLTGHAVEAAAAKLEEERLAAVERCLELELALGNEQAVVGELAELVGTYPLRERFVGQLMRALVACGRKADALAAYHRLRARLDEELGLDPGADLRRLYEAALRNEAVTDDDSTYERPTVPAQLPTDLTGFTGRAAELKQLDELLDSAAAGVVIVAISGTAGVGKTSLAVHWAHRVVGRFPDGQLYVNLRGFDQRGSPMSTAEAVRGFLDAFQVPPDRIPVTTDAQVNLYRSLLAGRRMLVVLDNAPGAEQVRPLLPGAPGCAAVVTSRSRLTGLVAAEGAHPLVLDRLTTDEAHDLLSRRLGAERLAGDPRAARAIAARCAGLPLALAVAAARAATNPALPLGALAIELGDARVRLDTLAAGDAGTDVRAVFSWSYHQLTDPAADVFRLLGLHPGPDIATPAVASLSGLAPERVRPALAELTRVHLVEQTAPDRFALHDLLRAYAAELAGGDEGERHAALHRVLDHYLHTAQRAERMLNPGHRQPPGGAAPQPGVTPEEHGDHHRALRWFTAEHLALMGLLRVAAAHGFDRYVWQLGSALSTYLLHRGHYADQVVCQRVALGAARRAGDVMAQAHAHRDLGRVHLRLGQPEVADRCFRAALDLFVELDDPVERARIEISLCSVGELRGRYREGLSHARRALTLGRGAGDAAVTADALNAVGWCLAKLGEHRDAVTYCRQAVALCRKLGNHYCAAAASDSLGFAMHELGEHRTAAVHYREALDLYRKIGDRYGQADVLAHLSATHAAAGEPGLAREARAAALSILDELGRPQDDRVRLLLTL